MSDDELKLTALAGEAGAIQAGPDRRAQIFGAVQHRTDEDRARLLSQISDTTAVFRLDDDLAIVQAVALLPPVVDDPRVFGSLAAAHTMNAIYAVGGEVLTASILAALPEDVPPKVVSEILRGASDKLSEADATLAGGQILVDTVPRFGLSVVGNVAPSLVLGKAAARTGDVVLLSKGLGTGIVLEAARRGIASEAHLGAAVASMLQLNRGAMRLARAAGAHAMSLVSENGLLASALEIAEGSGVQVALRAGDMPLLPGALQYAGAGIDTAASNRNMDELAPHAEIEEELPGAILRLIFDPQTSGGLLFTLPVATAAAVLQQLREAGYQAGVVGSVLPGSGAAVDP